MPDTAENLRNQNCTPRRLESTSKSDFNLSERLRPPDWGAAAPKPFAGSGGRPLIQTVGGHLSFSSRPHLSPLFVVYLSLNSHLSHLSHLSLSLSLALSVLSVYTLSLYILSVFPLSLSDSFTVSPQKQIVCHIAVRLWQVPQQTQMCTQEHSEAAAAEADGDIRFFVPGGGSRPLCGACRPSASCRNAA